MAAEKASAFPLNKSLSSVNFLFRSIRSFNGRVESLRCTSFDPPLCFSFSVEDDCIDSLILDFTGVSFVLVSGLTSGLLSGLLSCAITTGSSFLVITGSVTDGFLFSGSSVNRVWLGVIVLLTTGAGLITSGCPSCSWLGWFLAASSSL